MATNKIRVGLVATFPPEKGGVAIISKNLYGNLKKICHVVTIGLNDSKADYKISVTRNFDKDLNRIIEKERLDILHVQYITSGRYLGVSGTSITSPLKTIMANFMFLKFLKLRIPKVVTLSEVHTNVRNNKDRISKFFEKIIAEKSDGIIVYEESLEESLKRNWGIDAEYIPHGIREIKTPRKSGKTILFQGLINPEKGLEYLIDAMRFLPDFSLIIKGQIVNQKYAETLKSRIESNKLDNVRIEFGWVGDKEKDRLYKSASIVVVPYVWAPYPSGILHEAISYRIPLVVTDIPSLSHIVNRFQCGVVVKTRDPEDIANGVRRVFNNYENYLKGLDSYRKVANWKSVAEMHIKFYNSLLDASN
ncbi:MAG: glycosyltransferase family 4 protein [Candidatus Aenigmarchaeota archaeon]|nr:glycosyltransferase family 4 protein [Candidatus Aenigmarchaeota archaeon]